MPLILSFVYCAVRVIPSAHFSVKTGSIMHSGFKKFVIRYRFSIFTSGSNLYPTPHTVWIHGAVRTKAVADGFYMGIDGAAVPEVAVAPDILEELVAPQDGTGIFCKL